MPHILKSVFYWISQKASKRLKMPRQTIQNYTKRIKKFFDTATETSLRDLFKFRIKPKKVSSQKNQNSGFRRKFRKLRTRSWGFFFFLQTFSGSLSNFERFRSEDSVTVSEQKIFIAFIEFFLSFLWIS